MLNMDFSQRVVIHTEQTAWQASPMPGVWRKPLAREGAENGHATSIVRYEAGSHFKTHSHPLGEEIFVLDGVFSDEYGDYPAGSYFRNPDGTHHAPYSKKGCTLFVKLHQFYRDDKQKINLDTNAMAWQHGQGNLKVKPLHSFTSELGSEQVALVFWPKGEYFKPHKHFGGEEIWVISGVLEDEHGQYPAGTWLRNPHLSEHFPFAVEDTVIWVKVGHLLP